MTDATLYLLAADVMLFFHVLFVLFVVVGLLLIFVGRWRCWNWVYGFCFRLSHLAAIGYVVLQSWFGMICPLTLWEMNLRERAGDAVYQGSFIAYWLNQILYFRAPEWVFVLVYTGFGTLVVASWFWVRPRR